MADFLLGLGYGLQWLFVSLEMLHMPTNYRHILGWGL